MFNILENHVRIMKKNDKIWLILAVFFGLFALMTGTEWYHYLSATVSFLSMIPILYKHFKHPEQPQRIWKN